MKVTFNGTSTEMAEFFRHVSGPTSISVSASQPDMLSAPARSDSTVVADEDVATSSIGFVRPAQAVQPTSDDLTAVSPKKRSFKARPAQKPSSDNSITITDTDVKIMNFLLDKGSVELSDVADHMSLSRSNMLEHLARMEKNRWVRSEFDASNPDRMLFAASTIQRKYVPYGWLRGERVKRIYETIREYPGHTNREIGCRLILSTEDVASYTSAYNGRTVRREGIGNQRDPFRYFVA